MGSLSIFIYIFIFIFTIFQGFILLYFLFFIITRVSTHKKSGEQKLNQRPEQTKAKTTAQQHLRTPWLIKQPNLQGQKTTKKYMVEIFILAYYGGNFFALTNFTHTHTHTHTHIYIYIIPSHY